MPLSELHTKDFKFTGWHPHCCCHAESILKTEEEMAEDNKERAKGWSSMPYFIRQNPQYVQGFEVDTYTKAERKFTRARKTNEAFSQLLSQGLSKLETTTETVYRTIRLNKRS